MPEQHETAREFSAVPVVVVVFAIGAAVVGGIWLDPWAPIMVTVGFTLVAGLVVWSMRRERLGDPPHRRVVTTAESRYFQPVKHITVAGG